MRFEAPVFETSFFLQLQRVARQACLHLLGFSPEAQDSGFQSFKGPDFLPKALLKGEAMMALQKVLNLPTSANKIVALKL